jgi:GT2 family glycosyltransferase
VYSYFSGYRYLNDQNILNHYDIIYFINDSILFPICDETTFIDKIIQLENDTADVCGMCKSGYMLQSYWLAFKKRTYTILDTFIKNYKHCSTLNVEAWWEKAKNNRWILTRYDARRKIVDDMAAKKWIYTVVNFENKISKYMTNNGMTLVGANNSTWINSEYIIKRTASEIYPLVSIILTLYNIDLKYVKEALHSLLAQSYKNIEIICIDDASNVDYSELAKLSCKIRLIRNEQNLGLHKSVSKGFKEAKGTYTMRLGSDDLFDINLVKKEVDFLEKNPEYDAVCCQLQSFGESDRLIRRPRQWNLKNILNGAIGGTGYAGGMMFKTELLKYITIDDKFKMCEDFDFHLQILEHGKIASIHESLYLYRIHQASLCHSIRRTERIRIFESVLQKHRELYKVYYQDKK